MYFAVLKDAGVLPDLKVEDHGEVIPLPVADLSQAPAFPFSVKVRARVKERETIYWCLMEKAADSAEWKITKILETNIKNDILTDSLSVPSPAEQSSANVLLKKAMKDNDWE